MTSKIKYTGVDAKFMQYVSSDKNIITQIDFPKILNNKLNVVDNKCEVIMINLEKDKFRYNSCLEELKKISITTFHHLKGTYWKDKYTMQTDLSEILLFLSTYTDVQNTDIEINDFSESNNGGVLIQDGPLGCYCSHLRAMIYGYKNFKDYIVVVEDDIYVVNTTKIDLYIKEIPDDWDIICLNASPKNLELDINVKYYKFTEPFHSCHFYIVKKTSLPRIFSGLYPITDQVDVLISNMRNIINIYNIPETVYQKDIATNTQNNLHTIYNSPNYNVVMERIYVIEKMCLFFSNKILPENENRNTILSKYIIFDILYNYITSSDETIAESSVNKQEYKENISEMFKINEEYYILLDAVYFFVKCCKKGINIDIIAKCLVESILHTLYNFTLHNTYDNKYNEQLKAYDFGSSANVYIMEKSNIIVKKYNSKLRWTCNRHEDPNLIFNNELTILKLLNMPNLIEYDVNTLTIKLEYCGKSLFEKFDLPGDWKNQIKTIFIDFDKRGIYYPEFKLNNILINNGIITICDYGLSISCNNNNNKDNFEKFVLLLEKLENKLKNKDITERYILYNTFIKSQNIKKYIF